MDGVAELDSLTVYNLVDNEVDSLSAACACCFDPSSGITYRNEWSRMIPRKKALAIGPDTVCGAHGLSLLLVAEKDGKDRYLLFDAGPSPQTFEDNVRKLYVDVTPIEHFVLSHYHIDHSGGMRSAVPMIAKARAAAGLPPPVVDLHPNYPDSRGFPRGDGSVLCFAPENPSFSEIEEMGGVVCASSAPRAVCDGCFFVSGEIPRHTSYENGLPGQVSKRGGRWEDDGLMLDERYVAAKIKGGGVVVFSACSHAGIVNVCRDAVAKAGAGSQLFGVMGGFHLAGGSGNDPLVTQTVRDLVKLNPSVIFPGHCTGWRAKMALEMAFSGKVQPAVVGGEYVFSASG